MLTRPLSATSLTFLGQALSHGANATRVALAAVPFFAKQLASAKHLQAQLVALLRSLARVVVPGLLESRHLFEALGSVLAPAESALEDTIGLCAELLPKFDDTLLLRPAVLKVMSFVTSSTIKPFLPPNVVESAFELLTGLARFSEWHPYLVEVACELVVKGPPLSSAPFFRALLTGPSVRLVVTLSCYGRFGTLSSIAKETQGWEGVRCALLTQYPSSERAACTTSTCPITLCPMSWPVVASDGHTYERLAILEHMVRNGLTSPLTKQQLTYDLVPNWALVTCQAPM
jgi:hypothetical protein